jgi:hypothetical protein
MTPLLEQMIRDTVGDKIAAGATFSAFDITKEVRAEKVPVVHGELKEIVHRMFDDGQMPGYDRRLVDYGGPVEAWQYYPKPATADPDDDDLDLTIPAHLQPSSLRTYPLGGPATPVVASASDPPAPGVFDADGRNTICIPSAFVRAMNYTPGDEALVYIDPQSQCLFVSRRVPYQVGDDHLAAKVYTVDKHHNIRVTEATQIAAGMHCGQFQIELISSEIVISIAI